MIAFMETIKLYNTNAKSTGRMRYLKLEKLDLLYQKRKAYLLGIWEVFHLEILIIGMILYLTTSM